MTESPTMDCSSLASAYEGVESAANFADTAAVSRYRATALAKSADQAAFIASRFPEAATMAEACCGNARLMVALADRMERAEGFDISDSRIAFAQDWIADAGLSDRLTAWQDDLFNMARPPVPADVSVCITGAFGYFAPLAGDGDRAALERLTSMTRPGGGMVLELYQYPAPLAHCAVEPDHTWRRWMDLPESDPFRFSLSCFRFDPSARILSHDKIFIARDGHVDEGRRESLRIYAPAEIAGLLEQAFTDIRFCGDWSGRDFRDGDRMMIVTARRRERE